MLLKVVALCMVLLSSASALSVPRQANTNHPDHHYAIARRNETTAMAGELTLNIDPDINDPECGGIYEAQINVKQAPDPFYLSDSCNQVLSYIGGNKGSKDVDVIFTCPGGTPPGVGDRDIKFVVNLVSAASIDGTNGGTQLAPCNLEVVNEKDNTLISTQINLGVKVTDSKAKAQFIYC